MGMSNSLRLSGTVGMMLRGIGGRWVLPYFGVGTWMGGGQNGGGG